MPREFASRENRGKFQTAIKAAAKGVSLPSSARWTPPAPALLLLGAGTTDTQADRATRGGLPALNPRETAWSDPSCFSLGPTDGHDASAPRAAAAGTGRDEPCGVDALVRGLSASCLQAAGVSRTSPCAQFRYFQTTYLLLTKIYSQILIYAKGIQRFR